VCWIGGTDRLEHGVHSVVTRDARMQFRDRRRWRVQSSTVRGNQRAPLRQPAPPATAHACPDRAARMRARPGLGGTSSRLLPPSGGLTAQAPQAVAWAASAATMNRSKQTSYPQASKQSSKGSRHRRRV
jgi:hypothetical protein